jgi:hypothetical protein
MIKILKIGFGSFLIVASLSNLRKLDSTDIGYLIGYITPALILLGAGFYSIYSAVVPDNSKR